MSLQRYRQMYSIYALKARNKADSQLIDDRLRDHISKSIL